MTGMAARQACHDEGMSFLAEVLTEAIGWPVALGMIAWALLSGPKPIRRHQEPASAPEPAGLRFTAWGLTVTLEEGGWSRDCTLYTVDVSLDEAADLADLLLGGPSIHVAPHFVHGSRPFAYPPERIAFRDGWTVWIRAFIDVEALLTLHEIEDMMRAGGALPLDGNFIGRWRGGELKDVSPWLLQSSSSPA